MTVENTPVTRLSFARSEEVFFQSGQDDIATLLLALLCHSQAIPGSVLSCSTLTAAQATLLVPYRPARVEVLVAERAAVSVLEAAEIPISAATTRDRLEGEDGDTSGIVDLWNEVGSPAAFRDRLRMHLLAALQKRGRLEEDWLTVSPETYLGDGGGGT